MRSSYSLWVDFALVEVTSGLANLGGLWERTNGGGRKLRKTQRLPFAPRARLINWRSGALVMVGRNTGRRELHFAFVV